MTTIEEQMQDLLDLQAMRDEPLHSDLLPWVNEGEWGPMLRHPLVYMIPLMAPGMANRAYAHKQKMIAKAEAEQDWSTIIWAHERPYRLRALIDYVTGRNDWDEPIPLMSIKPDQATLDLVADVWVDSENIAQCVDDWRALLDNGENGLWLGTPEEREEFDALPVVEHVNGPHLMLWRGGAVGDWSWTSDERIARFFSQQSGFPVRGHLIPKADVFGYLTRRQEAEALVKFTEFRRPLVYPVSGNEARFA